MTTWTNTTDHANNVTPFCTLHIPPQNGLPGGHATDHTNGTIDLTGSIGPINGIVQTKSAHAPLLCPEKTGTASWTTNITVSGVNAEGKATSISITHP